MRHMHIGLFIQATGTHVSGWRHPEAEAGAQNLDLLQRIAETAERGKLDFIFFADSYGVKAAGHPTMNARFEPLTLLAALATTTSRIGLAATASTTYTHPFHIARTFASLDHLSGGRAAWNVVTGSVASDAANFGLSEHPEHDERYNIAEEFVDVVRGLWDCWDDDAMPMDKATGTYLDADKLHPLNHSGKYFTVKGPMNISRAPQGHPIIIQAGSSGPGQALAARAADIVFTTQQSFEAAQSFYEGFKQKVEAAGRSRSDVALLPGLVPFIAPTRQEARDQLASLQDHVEPAQAFDLLRHRLGHDVSAYPLDGPVPDLPPSDGLQHHARMLMGMARRDNLTLRDVYNLVSSGLGQKVVCGTPTDVADFMEEWFVGGATDGFIIMPPWYPGCLDRFVESVVPELQRRSLFRTDYAGSTLRDHLGIKRPPRISAGS